MENLEELQKELHEIEDQIVSNLEELTTININLSSIKNNLSKGTLTNKLYQKYIEARLSYIKSKNEKLSINNVLKKRKKEIQSVLDKSFLNSDESNTKILQAKENLNNLKDKYFEFYKDKTRISGMRKMANQFITDIDKIMKTL